METVKSKLLSLEAKIKDLETKLNSVSGASPTIQQNNHTVFPSEEFIQCSLYEDLQTLKFAYSAEKIDHGKTEKKYREYYLLNPTEEIEEIVGKALYNHGYLNAAVTLFSFSESPEKIENYGYEIIRVQEVDSYGNAGSRPFSALSQKDQEKLRQELDKYFFQVASICSCQIRPTVFFQDITIRFRNEYEQMPHVSFYLTPFQECNHIKTYIKELTQKQITLTFTQHHSKGEPCIMSKDKYQIPQDVQLHMHIRGIQKNNSVDLLLQTS